MSERVQIAPWVFIVGWYTCYLPTETFPWCEVRYYCTNKAGERRYETSVFMVPNTYVGD